MLFTEAIGRESQSNESPELEPFKMAAEELMEYLPYIYHPKLVNEHEKSYQKVKTQTLAYDNKNKCQIKRDHSSTRFSLAASAFFFGSSAGSAKYRVEETAELLKMEDAQSTRWNGSSDSGSSTICPNEPAICLYVLINSRNFNRIFINNFSEKHTCISDLAVTWTLKLRT